MIWQILTRKNYIVVTGDRYGWRSLDYDMPIDIIKKAISRIEVQVQFTEMEMEEQRQADEAVEKVKNYLTTGK